MTLTSTHNPLLAEIWRAISEGRPTADGLIAAEGPHLIEEAFDSRWAVERILCATEYIERYEPLLSLASQRGLMVTEVGGRAFKRLSSTQENQGILALLKASSFGWQDLLTGEGPLVILDRVQDPGNAGTIIRSVEAFGGAGLVFTQGSVRISNGKLLRAAAGSAFRMPYLEAEEASQTLQRIGSSGRRLLALSADAGGSIYDCDLRMPFALVVGSEGAGVSAAFREGAETLAIPTLGVESLNAAVACSITLFEAARQRAAG